MVCLSLRIKLFKRLSFSLCVLITSIIYFFVVSWSLGFKAGLESYLTVVRISFEILRLHSCVV